MESKLAAGSLWHDTGYVFALGDGRPVDPDRISRDFAKIVKKAGLPHLTFHGLRHGHATMLLRSNANLKVVSERLGHASIATTADIYSHVLPSIQDAVAQQIDKEMESSETA